MRDMKQSDGYTCLKRKRKEPVSQSFENERCVYFIRDQFNTQDVFASIPAK